MRFIYALAAGGMWMLFLQHIHEQGAMVIPDELILLTLCIIMAGALAGGGDK